MTTPIYGSGHMIKSTQRAQNPEAGRKVRLVTLAVLVAALPVIGLMGCDHDPRTRQGPPSATSRTVQPGPATRSAPARTHAYSRDELERLVGRIAQEHGIDPAFVAAVVDIESAWNPHAVSPKGALGLMQMMPSTARHYFGLRDERRLFEPETNVRFGVDHLVDLLTRYCDPRLALWAWNAGPGRVDPAATRITPAESRQFVPNVLSRYRVRRGDSGPSSMETILPGACAPGEPTQLRMADELAPEFPSPAHRQRAPVAMISDAQASALRVRVGEPLEIRLRVSNEGGTARRGTVRVLLVDHPRMRLGFRSDLATRFLDGQEARQGFHPRPGETVLGQIRAEREDWPAGQEHTLDLRFVPGDEGTIHLYYIFELEASDGVRSVYPASPGRPVQLQVTRTLGGDHR